MLSLEDTEKLMHSKDFKDRFICEYWQTKIRYEKLHDMVVKMDANTIDFKPKCSKEIFKQQLSAMGQYLYILEVRAEIEHIDLRSIVSPVSE